MKRLLQWPYNLLIPVVAMICTLILIINSNEYIEGIMCGIALGISYMSILEAIEKRHKSKFETQDKRKK